MEVELNNIGTLIRNERLRRGITQEMLGLKVELEKPRFPKSKMGKGLR